MEKKSSELTDEAKMRSYFKTNAWSARSFEEFK